MSLRVPIIFGQMARLPVFLVALSDNGISEDNDFRWKNADQIAWLNGQCPALAQTLRSREASVCEDYFP